MGELCLRNGCRTHLIPIGQLSKGERDPGVYIIACPKYCVCPLACSLRLSTKRFSARQDNVCLAPARLQGQRPLQCNYSGAVAYPQTSQGYS